MDDNCPVSDTVITDETVRSGRCKDEVSNTGVTEADGSCRDYDDFWKRTEYTVPKGVLAEDGSMAGFDNDLVIRYLDKVVVREEGYDVVFKAGVTVEVEV